MTWTHLRLPALGLGAAAVLVLGYALSRPGPPPAPSVAEAPPPSGDNVSPAVHARLMTLREAAEASPEDPATRLDLARFLQDAHRNAEAAEAYEVALALAPGDRQAWLDLTNAYGAAADWPAAASAADRMADRFPSDGAALYNAGAAYANAGETNLAEARFEAATAAADSAMAARARTSLAQLEASAAAPAALPPTAAPPLPPDRVSGPLPAGHPPIPPGTGASSVGGVTSRVVASDEPAEDPGRIRAALARQTPLSARDDG